MVAVASLAVLALLALTMIEATRGSTRSAQAELDRARLTAAADAGVALAVQGLAQPSAARQISVPAEDEAVSRLMAQA